MLRPVLIILYYIIIYYMVSSGGGLGEAQRAQMKLRCIALHRIVDTVHMPKPYPGPADAGTGGVCRAVLSCVVSY